LNDSGTSFKQGEDIRVPPKGRYTSEKAEKSSKKRIAKAAKGKKKPVIAEGKSKKTTKVSAKGKTKSKKIKTRKA
jgi:hypothetical protein